jgi:hypothetical protein
MALVSGRGCWCVSCLVTEATGLGLDLDPPLARSHRRHPDQEWAKSGRARGSRNDSSKVTQKPLGPGTIEKTVFLIHARFGEYVLQTSG